MTEPDKLARWLFERLNISPTPPVDVEQLAARMGITAITNALMVEDGRLEQDGLKARIYLRDGLPRKRRRFTIAHELAHRLLLHPRAPAERYRRRLVRDAEERLCDDIAAAILLPRGWVTAAFSSAPHTLGTVRRLSDQTDTSMSASLVRLCEVLGWEESLLRFRHVDSRWRLDAPAAVPFDIHGQIRTTRATTEVLSAIGAQSRHDTHHRLPLRIGTTEQAVPAETSVAATVAIALVELRTQLRLKFAP
jgi:IrrE N-terminal-like domain